MNADHFCSLNRKTQYLERYYVELSSSSKVQQKVDIIPVPTVEEKPVK